MSEWVSVLIVICTWHSRTPNADQPPLSASVALSPLWCGAHPSGRTNNYVHTYVCSIYMYVCIVIFYSWMFTIYPTYEWLYTYIHTCIYTYLVNYTYVCMYVCPLWMFINCTMYAYVPHVCIYHFIYLYVCLCGVYPIEKNVYVWMHLNNYN